LYFNFPLLALQEPTISSKPTSKATLTSSSGSAPEKLPLPDSKLSSESSVSSQTSEQETDDKSEEETSEQPKEESEDSKSASGGAFNPETGEINWDCPCLGGMAHGPCGPEFREAFSCFVFSEQEPKGIDCVEKFQAMQECFRQHPEVYRDGKIDDFDEARLCFAQPISEIDDEEEAAKAVDEAGAEESTSTSSPTTVPSTPQDTLTTPTEPNTSS